jgi:hypothetical protein
MPWDICNFFLCRKLKVSVSFRYLNTLNLKGNLYLLKTVLWLKLGLLKVKFKNFKQNYKLEFKLEKKLINNKERYSLLIQLLNLKNQKIYYTQSDSNIWWKPKKLINETDTYKSIRIGWLFSQIGVMKVKEDK